MSYKKRKFFVDVKGQVELIYHGSKVLERSSKALGENRRVNPEEVKKNWEDYMHKVAKRAQFLSSIEDLKEIQSHLDELRDNFSKEKQALQAISHSTETQHDDVEATFIKEKEALEAKYHKLFLVQYAKRHDDDFKAKMYEETRALEANYLKLCEPLYTKRCQVVNGVGHAECAIIGRSSENENIEGVPDFWLTVMKSNPVLLMEIKEKDEEALKLLKDIKLCRIENPNGFKLEFYFADNSFFKNQILTKTYEMVHEDDVVPKNIIGSKIEWYPRTRRVRVSDSFFNFFNPLRVPDVDGDIDEELLTKMLHDYEIGCALADIVPNAISRYLQVADIGELPEEGIEEDTEEKYSGSEPDDDEAYW